MVPGYQFTPQYRAKLWDGKIRLFDTRQRQVYRGLVPEIAKFCEERGYDWNYENDGITIMTTDQARHLIDLIKEAIERAER